MSQFYTQIQWGINEAAGSPYGVGAFIDGNWTDFATVSSAGVWSIPVGNISGVLPIVNGGTGANNAPDARQNLGIGTTTPIPVYPGGLDWTLDLAWDKNSAELRWTSNQTSASTRRPYLETDATLDLTLATPPDFPGAQGGSYPVGFYASHRQIGGSAANNAFTHSIMAYALNSAIGDNDVIGVSGRVTKTDVVGGIGDAGGIWGSAYQLSYQPGMVIGGEFAIYQNVSGSTARDRLDNNTFATSVATHLISASTGSPTTAMMGVQSVPSSLGNHSWGTWNGIILDGSLFDHDAANPGPGTGKAGVAGTVGINCGSWSGTAGYPEIGIKFGDAGTHIYRGNAALSIETNTLALKNAATNGATGVYARSTGAGNAYIDLGVAGGSGAAQLFWDGSGNQAIMGTVGAFPVIFRTNQLERAKITGAGDFEISGTGSNFIVSGGGDALVGKTNIITGYGWGLQSNGYAEVYRNSSTAAFGIVDMYSDWGAAKRNVFRIQSDGNVYNFNGTYGTISDESLKENIANADPALAKIQQVGIKKFSMKVDHKDAADRVGCIAQELALVFPELVSETQEGLMAVNYAGFIPYIVKALQELAERP